MDKKVFFLTGASSGFGYETLKLLLKNENNIVYISVLNSQEYEKFEGLGVKPMIMDVCDEQRAARVIEEIIKREGRLDGVLANAGYGSYGLIEGVSEEEFKKQFDVNVFGVIRTVQAALPYLRAQRKGRIVITTSVVSRVTFPGIGFYSATKHAVKSIATALRQEVKQFNIDVILIEPGAVQTNFLKTAFEALDNSKVDSDYDELVHELKDFMNNHYDKAPGAKNTAKKMYHALTKRKPKKVYRTTIDSKYLSIIIRFLGEGIYDFLILAYYKMISKKQHKKNNN